MPWQRASAQPQPQYQLPQCRIPLRHHPKPTKQQIPLINHRAIIRVPVLLVTPTYSLFQSESQAVCHPWVKNLPGREGHCQRNHSALKVVILQDTVSPIEFHIPIKPPSQNTPCLLLLLPQVPLQINDESRVGGPVCTWPLQVGPLRWPTPSRLIRNSPCPLNTRIRSGLCTH